MHEHLMTDPAVLGRVMVIAVVSSLTNVVQTWLFVLALGITIPFVDHVALSTAAIFAGMIPVTFAGIGTRDAAIVMLYSTYADSATCAALGVLFTMRYIVLVAIGLPFFLTSLAPRAGDGNR